MPVGHVVPQMVLVAGAAVTLLHALAVPRHRQWVGAWLALGTVAAAAATTAILMASVPQQLTFFGTWAVDGAAQWATLIVLGVTAVAIGLSPEWFGDDPRHGEYYSVLLFSALGATLMAGAADTMELVLGVLLSSVTGYTLAAYHRRSAASVEAGIKYFLLGALTNALLLVGVALLFGLVGSTIYGATQDGLASGPPSPALPVAAGLVALGLAFKLGAVPAHAWVPDVAQGAPGPAAAFLTVAPKVGALVALARVLSILPAEQVGWRPLAAVLAATTMTLGNLAALWQDDLRRLLGWSAVSQSGYGLMALVAVDRSPLAVPALLLFMAAYALANTAAFGVVVELRGRTNIGSYRGLAAAHPWLAAALALSLLSLVGVPPLAGFTGKLTLFAATIDAGYLWLAVLGVGNTVVSLFYYLRVLGPVYFEAAPAPAPVLGRWAGTATLAAALGVVVAGVAAEPLLAGFTSARLLP